LLIVQHHRELDQPNLAAGKAAHRVDKSATDPGASRGRSDVHAPKCALVSSFLTVLKGEAGDADQLATAKRAEHSGTAQSIRKPTQRLTYFQSRKYSRMLRG
jgi:putative Ca2+/H+ antiporter (TMEM165/GDT1 family)